MIQLTDIEEKLLILLINMEVSYGSKIFTKYQRRFQNPAKFSNSRGRYKSRRKRTEMESNRRETERRS